MKSNLNPQFQASSGFELNIVLFVAANPAQCIRTAAQNATANLTLVIREDINRSFSGSNNVTGRTHDIISNATSLIVKNITDA